MTPSSKLLRLARGCHDANDNATPMSKPSCRDKRAYGSREEAEALAMPGTDIYLCPRCANYHATSKLTAAKNRKRFHEIKWRARR
jgi:hypothetical protein